MIASGIARALAGEDGAVNDDPGRGSFEYDSSEATAAAPVTATALAAVTT